MESYTKEEAIQAIEDSGHNIYTEETADAIASTLNFKYDKKDFVLMKNDPPYMYIPKELEGQKGYTQLGYDACKYWNLQNKAWTKSGRGAKAHEYVLAIRKHLNIPKTSKPQ